MKKILFVKMAGAGNDFIIADNRKGLIKGLPETARRLCDRKHAIGADGLILLERSKSADIRMRILNPDGSEAEMCGNGVRCLARFAVDQGIVKSQHTIETLAGLIRADVRGAVVKARMVEPKGLTLGIPLTVGGKKEILNFIDTGVPHAVKVVPSVASCDVDGSGRVIRFHRYFAPRGTNVNFIALKPGNAIEIRTYERGVETETLACGTGSVAGALVAASLKKIKSPVRVKTRGGEVLKIYFTKKNGAFTDVYLEGSVEKCFEGRVNL